MRYAIAHYLTPAEKARAVVAHYCAWGDWLTADGQCPLGVALGTGTAPGVEGVVALLADRGEPRALFAAAAGFLQAWDSGAIGALGLAAALGVEL